MSDSSAAPDWKRRDAIHHDREAPRYDELIGREFAPYQVTHTAEPWARLLAGAGASVVLDLGCGTGRTSLPVARAGPLVIACDLSRGMLAEAVRKARSAGLDRKVMPLIADAERLPLREEACDGVVCQGVLHHLPDPSTALAELDRCLSSGGWMCLAEPSVDASRLYLVLRWASRRVAGALRPMARYRSPSTEDERPLEPQTLLRPLSESGYRLEPTYLRHPPLLYRFLSPAWGLRLVRWLNPGDRSRPRRADIFVLRARAPERD